MITRQKAADPGLSAKSVSDSITILRNFSLISLPRMALDYRTTSSPLSPNPSQETECKDRWLHSSSLPGRRMKRPWHRCIGRWNCGISSISDTSRDTTCLQGGNTLGELSHPSADSYLIVSCRLLRYLNIDKTPLAVLQMIDRFVRLHNGKPLGELDITEIFPQLICMRVEDGGYDGKYMTDPFRLELFRPMSLDDIHCLEFDDALYMKDDWNPCYAKQVCIYQLLPSITSIRIRGGAHILPSSIEDCAHAARLWKNPKTKFSLQIDSEVTDYDLECSIARVLDMLAEGTHPEERQPLLGQSARKRRITLSCYPALFDAFIRVGSDHFPLEIR
jgi:hypothetical protein